MTYSTSKSAAIGGFEAFKLRRLAKSQGNKANNEGIRASQDSQGEVHSVLPSAHGGPTLGATASHSKLAADPNSSEIVTRLGWLSSLLRSRAD